MDKKDDFACWAVDLGTAFSCVAIPTPTGLQVIPNSQGNRITPSVVAFTDNEMLTGESAQNQKPMNPQNTLFVTKRLMGRDFNHPDVQKTIELVPYKILPNPTNKDAVVIEVKHKGEVKLFSPEQIAAFILMEMKKIAEDYLGKPTRDVIITCPAFFNNAQREATKDAATIAGLNAIRIINEPTAAALAYKYEHSKDMKAEEVVLITDFGAGTYDCSILEIDENNVFDVKATRGDLFLGGSDLDKRLADHCIQLIQKKYGENIKQNQKAVSRLTVACERAKKTLSSQQTAIIEIDSLWDGKDFQTTISRAKFEDLCVDLFKQAFVCIEEALKQAKKSKNQIDRILCVGGSSRIPKFRQMLKDFFGKEPKIDINPDEVVALGAAAQLGIMRGIGKQTGLLLDINPLTLGIETAGERMTPIIPAGTTIPCKKTQIFTTYADYQPGVTIKVYEGERKRTRDNNLLGTFDLQGIPKLKRGEPKIEVTFDVDANSILNVTAVEQSSNIKKNIQIKNESGRLTKEEVEKKKAEAAKFAEEDRKYEELSKARYELENLVYTIQDKMKDEKTKEVLGNRYSTIESKVSEVHSRLQGFDDSLSIEDITRMKEELETSIQELMGSTNSRDTPAQNVGTGPKIEEVD